MLTATARQWIKKEVSLIIEGYAHKAEFPKHLIKGLATIGAFGSTISMQYCGAGMDDVAYWILQSGIFQWQKGTVLKEPLI